MSKLTPAPSMLDPTSEVFLNYSNSLITLTEICHLPKALLSVAKSNIQLCERYEKSLGIPLPREPNTSVYGDCTVMRISSRSWHITGRHKTMNQLFRHIGEVDCGVDGTSLIDISDAYVRIRLQGRAARDLLSTGCSLNFTTNLNQTHTCAVTLLAKVSVILSVDMNGSFNIDIERSRAPYLWAWLKNSAIEFEDTNTPLLLPTDNWGFR